MLLAVVLDLASGAALAGAWAVAVWDLGRHLKPSQGGRRPPTRADYTLAA